MKHWSLLVLLAAAAGCGLFRSFQNPTARLKQGYADVEVAAHLTKSLLDLKAIQPDEAEAVSALLKVAKGHLDRAKATVATAESEGRTASPAEWRTFDDYYQAGLELLREVQRLLAAYEERRASR